METTKIAIFKGKKIRRVIYQNEWWFSVVDIVEVLTDSNKPRVYWNAMKTRVKSSDGIELSTICRQLKLESSDGKKYATDCANTEGIFRIIQSIPSPRAEPFKRWLAKVGYERIQEIENPELATKRTRMLYKLKGYTDDWIEKRMRGIVIREELTDEWQKRGAEEKRDYEILTAEISKATFGITPSEYKKLKGLQRENLRDHMDDFELIFTMLGEKSTSEIHRQEESKGVPKLRKDAQRGGKVAGVARNQLEKELGKSVVSSKNYLSKKTLQEKKYFVKSFDTIRNKLIQVGAKKIREVTSVHYYGVHEGNDVEKFVVYPDRCEIHKLLESHGKFTMKEHAVIVNKNAGIAWLKNRGYKIANIVRMDYTEYAYSDGTIGLYILDDDLYSVILYFSSDHHEKIEKEFGLQKAEVITLPYNKYLGMLGKLHSMELS